MHKQPKVTMTKQEMAIRAAIYYLKNGSMTCTNLGVQLWGKHYRNPQSYARPAGKLLHIMKRMGLVETFYDKSDEHFHWRLTSRWKERVSHR